MGIPQESGLESLVMLADLWNELSITGAHAVNLIKSMHEINAIPKRMAVTSGCLTSMAPCDQHKDARHRTVNYVKPLSLESVTGKTNNTRFQNILWPLPQETNLPRIPRRVSLFAEALTPHPPPARSLRKYTGTVWSIGGEKWTIGRITYWSDLTNWKL
jgi:hypothetical protein